MLSRLLGEGGGAPVPADHRPVISFSARGDEHYMKIALQIDSASNISVTKADSFAQQIAISLFVPEKYEQF